MFGFKPLSASLLGEEAQERGGKNFLAEKNSSQAKYLRVKHQEDQIEDFVHLQTKQVVPTLIFSPSVIFFLEQAPETKPCHLQTLTCHLRKHVSPQLKNCITLLAAQTPSSGLSCSSASLSSPFSTSADTQK